MINVNWKVVCDDVQDNQLFYAHGRHPAGYTDDLGIIADRDQWVAAEPSGWYLYPTEEVHTWCTENLESYHHSAAETIGDTDIFNPGSRGWIFDYNDVILFQLRWLNS